MNNRLCAVGNLWLMIHSQHVLFQRLFVVLTLTLTGCLTTPPPSDSCACSSYLTDRQQPAWVGRDQTNSQYYGSSGATQCTGVKSLDFKEADQNARLNLAYMMTAAVEGESNVIRRHDGSKGGGTEAKIRSRQQTRTLLQKSTIYDRWVDRKNCTLHSAVRMSAANFVNSQKHLRKVEVSKPVHQPIRVISEGELAEYAENFLLQQLSALGARYLNASTQSGYVIRINTGEPELHQEAGIRIVTTELSVSAYNDSQTLVWSRTRRGKTIRRGDSSSLRYDSKRAVERALQAVLPALKTFVNTPQLRP